MHVFYFVVNGALDLKRFPGLLALTYRQVGPIVLCGLEVSWIYGKHPILIFSASAHLGSRLHLAAYAQPSTTNNGPVLCRVSFSTCPRVPLLV